MKYRNRIQLNKLSKKQQRYVRQAISKGTKLETIFARVKRFNISNKGNRELKRLRSKSGIEYARKQYHKVLEKTKHAKGDKLTKAEIRAREKAYLKINLAKEYAARTKQVAENIKAQRKFMKAKFEALIHAGETPQFSASKGNGISPEAFVEQNYADEIESRQAEYEQMVADGQMDESEVPSYDEIVNEIWEELQSGSFGGLKELDQGEQYGYWDSDTGEIISPV